VGGRWTIALWVNWHDGPNTYEHPIGLGMGHDATFYFSDTFVAFKTTDASGNTVVDRRLSSSVISGTWYHLAATFDGTAVTGYLDGVEQLSVVAPTTTIRSSSIKIGTSGYSVNNFFNGTVDEVLVYNRALNASEIAALASSSSNAFQNPPLKILEAAAGFVGLDYQGGVERRIRSVPLTILSPASLGSAGPTSHDSFLSECDRFACDSKVIRTSSAIYKVGSMPAYSDATFKAEIPLLPPLRWTSWRSTT